MNRKLTYMLLALAALFTACDKDAHEDEYPLPAGQGGIIVGLQTETPQTEVDCLTLYLFDSNGTVAQRKTYTDSRILASEYIPAPAGIYTPVVVANADPASLPQQTTPADLTQWLKERTAQYPDLLTASTQTEIRTGEITRILMTLKQDTEGIALTAVRLLLTVPGKELPAYTPTCAEASAEDIRTLLRCVAEVFPKGTENRIHRREVLCEEQADGRYLAELSLLPGDYDLRLWTDRNGSYYNADNLSAVTMLTDNYVAGEQTEQKDAFYTTSTLNVGEEATEQAITLTRPFARYRLIANDVEGYLNLIANGEGYPPVEDLQVRITYEGFFPTGFDVGTGKPNDALNIGIHYTTAPVTAIGYPEAETRQVGEDFVLTNGEESFVTVTVQIIDPRTGEAISTVSGIQIPYKRGHLTTVTGRFLTAGKTTGGVQVDNDWENDVTIEF